MSNPDSSTPSQTAATDNALVEKLVREVPTGMHTIGSGSIGPEGVGSYTPSRPIMRLANPDGPEAAERIKSLLAENRAMREALTEALIIAEGYNTGASWAVAEHISEPLKAALATKGADSND